ncbi:MAG: LPXTG cell wall anchor domain-containing protein [Lactobacillales bacterium]|jgi:LPXTG-motif cell wall-anchored protein|nr:LPXTG cell wall anchor domain-containing protein [Lactobacillales bacterium]
MKKKNKTLYTSLAVGLLLAPMALGLVANVPQIAEAAVTVVADAKPDSTQVILTKVLRAGNETTQDIIKNGGAKLGDEALAAFGTRLAGVGFTVKDVGAIYHDLRSGKSNDTVNSYLTSGSLAIDKTVNGDSTIAVNGHVLDATQSMQVIQTLAIKGAFAGATVLDSGTTDADGETGFVLADKDAGGRNAVYLFEEVTPAPEEKILTQAAPIVLALPAVNETSGAEIPTVYLYPKDYDAETVKRITEINDATPAAEDSATGKAENHGSATVYQGSLGAKVEFEVDFQIPLDIASTFNTAEVSEIPTFTNLTFVDSPDAQYRYDQTTPITVSAADSTELFRFTFADGAFTASSTLDQKFANGSVTLEGAEVDFGSKSKTVIESAVKDGAPIVTLNGALINLPATGITQAQADSAREVAEALTPYAGQVLTIKYAAYLNTYDTSVKTGLTRTNIHVDAKPIQTYDNKFLYEAGNKFTPAYKDSTDSPDVTVYGKSFVKVDNGTKLALPGAGFNLLRNGATNIEYYAGDSSVAGGGKVQVWKSTGIPKVTNLATVPTTTLDAFFLNADKQPTTDATAFETGKSYNIAESGVLLDSSGTNKDAGAALEILGLAKGNYSLYEFKYPNNTYVPNTTLAGFDFTVDYTAVTSGSTAGWSVTLPTPTIGGSTTSYKALVNVPKTDLPNTGGIGIIIFVVTGIALMGGASFWYIRSRRDEEFA